MANLGELREMGSEDLVLRVTQLDNEVFRLRMQQGMGQGDKPNKMKQLKRERARARTLLRERELVAEGDS
jgi:large subunit ribosomal protein L29